MSYLLQFQSTYFDITKSILYSEGGTTMNYAKKDRRFYYYAYFFIMNT